MRGLSLAVALSLVMTLVGAVSTPASEGTDQAQGPTFRSGVDLVTVAVVVRDSKGRLVRELKRDQFEVLDQGIPRVITEFRPDQAPLTVALLFDASGSMRVASKMEAAKQVAAHVMAWLQSGRDHVALYAFDTSLTELKPFSTEKGDLAKSLADVEPFGMTSLHDAIAETARRVAEHGGSHRAVIVFTDGVDTSSRLTAPEVSGIASRIDVPVYVLAVTTPIDAPGLRASLSPDPQRPATGNLADLAAWTGGWLHVCTDGRPAEASIAAREVVSELRHQYLIAFEPGGQPGWHPLEIRTRDRTLIVRARSGYFAAQPRLGS